MSFPKTLAAALFAAFTVVLPFAAGAAEESVVAVSVPVGRVASVGFSSGTEGSWSLQYNSRPDLFSVDITSSNVRVTGIANGSGFTTVCRSAIASCMRVNVTVEPQPAVLGQSTYANGSLVKTGPAIFIVYRGQKIPFANFASFKGLGFAGQQVIGVPSDALPTHISLVVSSATASHPWGSWIIDNGTVYFVSEQGLIPVPSAEVFINNGGNWGMIVKANTSDMKLPKLDVMLTDDSRLR